MVTNSGSQSGQSTPTIDLAVNSLTANSTTPTDPSPSLSSSSSSTTKRRRRAMTDLERRVICRRKVENPSYKQDDIVEWF